MSDVRATIDPPQRRERFPRRRAFAHWLLALVVTVALLSGLVGLANTSDGDPAKVAMVRAHMLVGLLVAGTLAFQLLVAFRDDRPPHLPSGSRLLDLLARSVHQLLRLSILALVVTGVATVALSGLAEVVFNGTSDRIPEVVAGLPSFAVHAVVARVLLGLVALHLLGACYHQIVRKDGVIGRMWPFGRNRDRA